MWAVAPLKKNKQKKKKDMKLPCLDKKVERLKRPWTSSLGNSVEGTKNCFLKL
jgi:hypothetical protein